MEVSSCADIVNLVIEGFAENEFDNEFRDECRFRFLINDILGVFWLIMNHY